MPYSLKDRCVLVTGGSRGLGAVICRKFAEHGAHVMVNYVSNKTRAQQVVEEVDAFGVKAALVQGVCLFRFPYRHISPTLIKCTGRRCPGRQL